MTEFTERHLPGEPEDLGEPQDYPNPEEPDVTNVDPIKPDVSVRRPGDEEHPRD